MGFRAPPKDVKKLWAWNQAASIHKSGTRKMRKVLWLVALHLGLSFFSSLAAAEETFRPETGKFPALEKAHTYRGVLAFVDHANRRGSRLRITFFTSKTSQVSAFEKAWCGS